MIGCPARKIHPPERLRGRVGVQGGEAGVSAAERVGKFFGIYRNAADPARRAVLIERYLAEGKSLAEAESLARPYLEGVKGHHFVPQWVFRALGAKQRTVWGRALTAVQDSPFNVLKPSGISYGEMFDLHRSVEWGWKAGWRYGPGSRFYWTGEGLQSYGAAGKLWYGSPLALKATGAAVGGSAAAYIARLDDSSPTEPEKRP